MILLDYSSVLHRKIFTGVSSAKPGRKDGKFITSEFVNVTKYLILEEIFGISREFARYGELVVCLDNKSPEGYWRKDYLSTYKANRNKTREESEIIFDEVFPEVNELTSVIRETLPFRFVEVHRAEADDVILVLADEFKKGNLHGDSLLIHSPDKDFIQAQFECDRVHQYSSLTNKFITADDKSETIESWMTEHICLGDAGDGVPKIVDGTEFSDPFIQYLKTHGLENFLDPWEFKKTPEIPVERKIQLIQDFDVYRKNRSGEPQEKDVYRQIRFGKSTLAKEINRHGSLDKFLDSNRLLRENYERNKILVSSAGIPGHIRNGIISEVQKPAGNFQEKEFNNYLRKYDLQRLMFELPNSITSKRGELDGSEW